MEDQSSKEDRIPDIADPLATKTETDENQTSESCETHSVSVTPVEGVSVSSSVPVGSLINVSAGGTYNVITPEQLQVRIIYDVSHRVLL